MKGLLGVGSLVAAVLLAGCGAGAVSGDDALDSSADALSSRTAAYVTVQRDTRRCAAPACGGYFLSQPNHRAAAIYVQALDFTRSGLDAVAQAQVTGAPDDELLLYGKLSGKDRTGQRSLVVLDAYRGLPGRTDGAVSAIYTVRDNGTRCIQAPCMSLSAHKLNSTAHDKAFSTLSVASASYGFVDQGWLQHRVMDGGAVVMGALVTGAQLPGGDEKVFDVSQVFLHLPERAGPCPAMMQLDCAVSGQMNISTRNADRCQVPAGCADQGVCSQAMPACPDGYTRTGFAAGPSACMRYTCDPSWVLP